MAIAILGGNLVIYKKTQNIGNEWNSFDRGPAQKGVYLSQLRDAIGYGGMIHQFKDYVLHKDNTGIDNVNNKIDQAKALINEYKKIDVSKNENASLSVLYAIVLNYEDALVKAQQLVNTGSSSNEIDARIGVDDEPALAALKTLDEELIQARTDAKQNINNSVSGVTRLISTVSIITSVFIFIILVLVVILFKRILYILDSAVENAERIANGDLMGSIDVTSKDEGGMLLNALENMQSKLTDVVLGIKTGSDQVDSVSTQLANGNTNLSQRTQQQAASLEEVASSMEEMTSTVNQNADNAQQANQLAAG
ncbi:MAG: hypothetical protein V3V89_00790, partial [Gammaproteobacteria bacterium]